MSVKFFFSSFLVSFDRCLRSFLFYCFAFAFDVLWVSVFTNRYVRHIYIRSVAHTHASIWRWNSFNTKTWKLNHTIFVKCLRKYKKKKYKNKRKEAKSSIWTFCQQLCHRRSAVNREFRTHTEKQITKLNYKLESFYAT